jgi:opacity protein-like surface antigen
MPPQPVILESQNATSVADGATIERRIRISQPDEGRGRCKGSRAWDPRKDFSQPTQPPITPSTSNAVCLPGELKCSGSNKRIGGALGAGVEYGFTPNWSAKLEYRYTAASLEPSHINEVLVGVNYRFGGP